MSEKLKPELFYFDRLYKASTFLIALMTLYEE
jgi:hypothetical protein